MKWLALVLLASCGGSNAACPAAGGQCVIGPPTNCKGTVGPQDCNPAHNPGGAICCLPAK